MSIPGNGPQQRLPRAGTPELVPKSAPPQTPPRPPTRTPREPTARRLPRRMRRVWSERRRSTHGGLWTLATARRRRRARRLARA